MKIYKNPKKPRKNGFTLIEITTVVAIVSILVGIAQPKLASAKVNTRQAKEDAIITAVAHAKVRYQLKATDEEIAEYNAGNDLDKILKIAGYLNVQGSNPLDETKLVAGTGYTYLDPGSIDDRNTAPDEWAKPALYNPAPAVAPEPEPEPMIDTVMGRRRGGSNTGIVGPAS